MSRWLTSMTTAEPSHLLLDTHTLIWLATDDARISEKARRLVGDLKNDLYLSVASVWELAIKKSLGKIDLQMPLAAFVQSQTEALNLRRLDIHSEHALLVEGLPFHHRDPFDRMLVAQALHEGLSILGADSVFDSYSVKRLW